MIGYTEGDRETGNGERISPRLRRLRADLSELQEAFSSNPHVSIRPSSASDPPEAYDITFKLRGLRRAGDHPEYVDSHQVQIRLPATYPADQPYCVPSTPVFHPNVEDYFCIADHWSPATSLVDVVVKLGEMIQWHEYNIESPLDAEAAQWAKDHDSADFLPIGDVDIRPRLASSARSGSSADETSKDRLQLKAAGDPGEDDEMVELIKPR